MNDETDHNRQTGSDHAGPVKTVIVSVLILLVGAALVWLVFRTEPTAQRGDNTRETAMLVEVKPAESGRYTPTIGALGRVVPAQEVTLRPRVAGRILQVADDFTPGGTISGDQLLVELDPADYEAALAQRRSALHEAQADLQLERGRQQVARQEYALLGDQLEGGNRALMLRQPQLQQARARVESAEAALRQAELDLSRTRITAPFDALVLEREVNAGSEVGVGDAMAHLVGTDRYWIEATVPLSKLRWLRFDEDGDVSGSPVRIRQDSAWPAGQYREGHLARAIGEVDPASRMARVLIVIEDPLARGGDQPALMLGSFVQTLIGGQPLEDVVRLERRLIRRNDTVWIMQDGALSIRDVDILFQDADYAYIDGGIRAGEQVVISDLASVVEGAALRLEADEQ